MMKKLGFGTMRLPTIDPSNEGSVNITLTRKMVDLFMELGFSYFDTGYMYCGEKSEETLKNVLVKRYPRTAFQITDKLPTYLLESGHSCEEVLNEQVNRTGVDYFDCYMLHNINSKTLGMFEQQDSFSWLFSLKKRGIARCVGFSYHDGPDLLETVLRKYPDFDIVQLQINYLDWDDPVIQSRECYSIASSHGKSVVVMEPVKGGTLAHVPIHVREALFKHQPDLSIASWAIRFAASLDHVYCVLSGMSNMEQLQDNTRYMSDFEPISETDKQILSWAALEIRKKKSIPCTFCSYCTNVCDLGIPIPRYFALYNLDMIESKEKKRRPQRSYYRNLCVKYTAASKCQKCRKCEKICPQHLPIIKYLKHVTARFQ